MMLLSLVAAVFALAAPLEQKDAETKEVYTAIAANTSVDINAPPLFEIDIIVDRYTTAAEQETFATAFRKGGQEALLSQVQKAPKIGFYRVQGNLSYDIRAAFTFMGRDNRRRIILVTDRYVGFPEAAARPRSLDYPFTVFDMRVDDSGVGEGHIMVAAAVGFERNSINVEEYLNQSIRLTKVRRVKK
jgi:hypothetical protein